MLKLRKFMAEGRETLTRDRPKDYNNKWEILPNWDKMTRAWEVNQR